MCVPIPADVLAVYIPESTKPGLKMMYATAKASLVEQLTSLGVKPASSVSPAVFCPCFFCHAAHFSSPSVHMSLLPADH